MPLLELINISKSFDINNKIRKEALRKITLCFPNTGLISIVGPSGCGKSTMLNLIGKIDNPSEGKLIFNHKNIAKLSKIEESEYRRLTVGYVFQHYHLLEKHSALYNVILPLLLNGWSFHKAKKKAKSIAASFNVSENLLTKQCSLLSGGEKQRIAILRAVINSPKIIIADEPTGALDYDNSLLIMDALMKVSDKCLVIIVTHNIDLAYRYSNRVIHMSDGRVIKDDCTAENCSDKRQIKTKKSTRHPNWYFPLLIKNLCKRIKRNVFSLLSLTICIFASMMVFGFVNGADVSIDNYAKKQFDYGVLKINKEIQLINNNSPIILINNYRLNNKEINQITNQFNYCHIGLNYEALIGNVPIVKMNDEILDGLSFLPIYSYLFPAINNDLLLHGRIPKFDNLNQIIINNKAYIYLSNLFGAEPLGSFLYVESNRSFTFYTEDPNTPYVTDIFVFGRFMEIVGVVDEVDFFNTPKIYYSYLAIDRYMEETIVNNLSTIRGEISWKERVALAADNEDVSGYSHLMFLNNAIEVNKVRELVNSSNENFTISSSALEVEDTLVTLVNAASVGMEVFLAIALIGTALIIGLIAFASYSEDIKELAILLCLGARRDDIVSVYLFENIIVGLVGLALSFVLATLLQNPINHLIFSLTSLTNLIDIPFQQLRGRPFLFPLLIVVSTMLICILSTCLPLIFSKKISLSEELRSND